jgi:hypothetical protein
MIELDLLNQLLEDKIKAHQPAFQNYLKKKMSPKNNKPKNEHAFMIIKKGQFTYLSLYKF